jgi:hypothetical protein
VPKELKQLAKKYDKVVSISTQYTVEKELAIFIKNVAEMKTNIGFFFSLRHYDKAFYEQFEMPKNVKFFYKEYSCYDILKASDYHCTVYSTCAQEAEYFNKVVIMANIDNMSNKFIEIKGSDNMYIVDNANSFIDILNKSYKEEKNIFYNKVSEEY